MSDWNPNHGDQQAFKKKLHFGFNKEVNSLTFRIIPQPKGFKYGTPEYVKAQFKSDWHEYHSAVWGYRNMEGKLRIFESPLVKKKKVVEVPCAATDRVNDLKAKLVQAQAEGNGPIQAKLNALVGLKGVYNINNNEHFNVILLDGSIGELSLRYKAFLALEVEIDKLRKGNDKELGFDPLSFNNGRFFTVTRNGIGSDTSFNVSVYRENVDVPGFGRMERPLVHIITPEILARIETDAWDLSKIHLQVTSEECAQIVNESDLMSGKSPACNRIFDDKWKLQREARGQTQHAVKPNETLVSSGVATPVQAATLVSPPVTVGSLTPPVTATQTLPSNAVQAPVQTPTQIAEAQPSVQSVDEMSDEDFFKTIGVTVGA